ncbi:glycoside hydrolase family 36 protein [Alistipes senegalensis]|uniref:glycoside hydrolase family 36 protein n=1 Tax=Alistipes senegalensis TaxID=1288121 RepID=UPI00242B4A02|nr:glycoside hydrolase family 36 protein [Alistipes senegalensis]MCI7308994.1 alpha-galactosidase [Alistipes senegalensis]MDD7040084.1 alpha-galactosidase [Alistipes senegalensis]MDY2875544.1 glycoside hydrolase family 36 protein [Alistipes senegalensis]
MKPVINYRRTIIALTSALLLALGSLPASAQVRLHMQGDKTDIARWIDQRFAKGQLPPFSFILDEQPSEEFLRSWRWSRTAPASTDKDVVLRTFTYTDPRSGLEVACDVKGYPEFRAVEWVLHFRNTSAENSGQLTRVKVADFDMVYPAAGALKIHYAEGNKISKADYAPRTAEFRTEQPLHIEPHGGRSSEEAFPFFNLESEASRQGVMVAVGWTGTWFADLEKRDPSRLTLAAGMLNTDLYLYPGEQIRTPSVALMFWSGDRMNGHNRFRRLVLAHHSRKVDGSPFYPLCSAFNYRDPQPCGEYSCLTADWAVAMIRRYSMFELTPDVFWLDAGWHTGAGDFRHGKSWANTTGNWTVDRERFPEGLKPVSDAVHETGAKFMVWFEPERVVKGTQWATEHKEWMLDTEWPEGSEQSTWYLFDLGNDEACDWLCKYYGDLIEENGIDYYRQDFNMLPAGYWRDADEPGRSGIKEIRHIENLYKFWDYLLERFPGLLIDNCASGGKRLDWESIGRSAPLWRSDYYHYDDPDGYQCHTYGLNFFLPIHGTGILLPDQYSFRSSLSSALQCNWKVTEPGVSVLDMQQRIREYRDIREYYYEDYYPLSGTGDLTGSDVWLAYQMHRPSDDSGIVVAFRRQNAPDTEYTVRLGGLTPDASYTLVDCDTQAETVRSGRELTEGLTLRLDNPKSSLLIKYRKN